MNTFESIALSYSQRGMNILKDHLNLNFLTEAANALCNRKRGNLLILTGFYVGGAAETDGPVGSFCLAKTAKTLGFSPIILTDSFCKGIFEEEDIPVIYAQMDSTRKDFSALLEELKPSAIVSIERCGKNINGDYANMHGLSIKNHTAPLDLIIELAKQKDILTLGIGDGGNEIGMGNLASVITEKLSLVPCAVSTDYLIIASVSNWGAYGLSAAMLKSQNLKEGMPSPEEIGLFLAKIVAKGFVDGISKKAEFKVDGFSGQVEMDIERKMKELL